MSDKLSVSLKEAVDWAKKGYEIECFVMISPSVSNTKKGKRIKQFVAATSIVTLSHDGREPIKGDLLSVWTKVKKELWTKNATANYTRAQVDEVIRKHAGPNKSWIFSNLCGRLKCIRVITP